MKHNQYSLTELENMIPWEREIYVSLLAEHVEKENERIKKENQKMSMKKGGSAKSKAKKKNKKRR